MADTQGDSQQNPLDHLSEIDKRILRLVAQGRSSKEIGKTLHRSPLTVDGRLKEVCARVGAENRVQAASMLLLREVNLDPPNLGGGLRQGIDTPTSDPRVGDEDERPHRNQAAFSPTRPDRIRSRADKIRLFVGGNVGTESPGQRMARIAWTVLLIAVAMAFLAFFLATALEAFQGVVLGIRS